MEVKTHFRIAPSPTKWGLGQGDFLLCQEISQSQILSPSRNSFFSFAGLGLLKSESSLGRFILLGEGRRMAPILEPLEEISTATQPLLLL